ncbi:7TM diverse intracellular signaling domain-containing protein [Oligoflexus tunisiensis]|uniref:7TM diverse intracellular signaling domain-containing protein n=1 Tax=Oligoflexus tunisiensis TaxID=708132 RepID=UPI001C40205E|nr:7TM diverse intracellular signaling domain-containing protein [Oligoflexus tunisiensis]
MVEKFYQDMFEKHDSLSIDEVMRAKDELFQISETAIPGISFTANVVWYRINVSYLGSLERRYFFMAEGFFRHMEVYVVHDGKVIQRNLTGSFYHPSTRDVFDWGNEFGAPITLSPEKRNITVYFKTHSDGTVNLFNFKIYSEGEYTLSKKHWYIWQAFYFGSSFGLFIYHLIIFLISRQRVYALYASFLGCFILVFLTLRGFGVVLHDYFGGIHVSLSFNTAGYACLLLFLLFTRNFLGTNKQYKRSDWFLRGLAVLTFIMWVGSFWQSEVNGTNALNIHMIVCGLILLCLACMLVARGNRNGILYLVAFSLTITGFIIYTLSSRRFLPHSFFAENAVQVGSFLDAILLSVALGDKIRVLIQERYEEAKKKNHAYNQLGKVFYPHQIHQIESGRNLEDTMPTGPGEGCVICFDIIGSSKIQHVKVKDLFRKVFLRCYEHIMEGYDVNELMSNGYRIKEMGDGFLCSVGYPFKSRNPSTAHGALELAYRFAQVFQEEISTLDYDEPIHCGIGIAADSISGFYPESGTKEYDLYGRAIILATRYEGMRKIILKDKEPASILILQERVYKSLSKGEREDFTVFDLIEQNVVVRDDPAASKLYYRFLDSSYAHEKVRLRKVG